LAWVLAFFDLRAFTRNGPNFLAGYSCDKVTQICGEALGDSPLETLKVDELLPLWAAENEAG
jgi:hypothetical protein